MRWLAWIVVVGSVACTRVNPSYGEGGTSGGGDDQGDDPSASNTDPSASVGEDAEASADESLESADEATLDETGGSRPCCLAHRGVGCEEPQIEQCVCEGVPSCCEVEWTDDCTSKARTFCSAECPVADEGSLETTDTVASESSTSDSSGTSTTDAATMTSDSDTGSSTGDPVSDCCIAHDGPNCGDAEIEDCVCVTNGAAFCCEKMWTDDCVVETMACSAVCGG